MGTNKRWANDNGVSERSARQIKKLRKASHRKPTLVEPRFKGDPFDQILQILDNDNLVDSLKLSLIRECCF